MKLLPLFMAGVTLVAVAAHVFKPSLETESLPLDHIAYPKGKATAIVLLISDADGWSMREERVSAALVSGGVLVVGVDLQDYYEALADRDDECLYLVSDIEDLTRQLHRRQGIADYHPPIVAGIGDGGALALAIAAQTPDSTISETVAVDPGTAIPLATELCTPAPKTQLPEGIVYGLTEGDLPNPVRIVFTAEAKEAGRAHAQSLKETHPAVEIALSGEAQDVSLLGNIAAVIHDTAAARSPLDLPIVPIETRPRHNVMAIVYSGDGGWRDIDQQLGAYLKQDGIPVVGVDALRYFWSEKTPEQTAADLSRIIATYRKRWKVDHVLLIGYSFGANILPATYRLLPEEDKKSVALMSLLALSHEADFEIAVTGWLGFAGAGEHGDPVDDLDGVEPSKIQCIHGLDEDDSACPAVAEIPGTQVISREGGHHFDGDYRALNDLIVNRVKQLIATN